MKKNIFILSFIISACSNNKTGNTSFSSSLKDEKKTESISGFTSIDTSYIVNSNITPFTGDLYYNALWMDSNGKNIFILSKTMNYKEGEGTAELYGYHYIAKENNWQLLWKTYDQVQGNGCDLNIEIPKDLIRITDLDSNNITETSYLYTLDNRCDAVIVPTKMIIHIGKEKYAIRGFSDLKLGPPEELMNKYLLESGQKEIKYKDEDQGFQKLPKQIQTYYSELWDEFAKK